jgi:hypothetical protein
LQVQVLASRLALLLLAIVVVLVLLHALMIAGAAHCASGAPDFRCTIARFIAADAAAAAKLCGGRAVHMQWPRGRRGAVQ